MDNFLLDTMMSRRKNGGIFISLAFALFIACSCSGSDGLKDPEDAPHTLEQTTIFGKWKLVRQGDIDLGNSMEYLEFYENGKVRYERGVGTDDYSLIESQLEYETDWALSYNDGNIIRMSGHILFMMWGEGLYLDEPNRFLCWVENDKMWLLPDDGDRYIMNPTLLFTKVK